MACESRVLAHLNDVQKWKKYLFAGEKDDVNWLHKCVLAVSPVGDKILVAHGPALVLLNLQWDKDSDKTSAELVVHRQWDSVEELKIPDVVTSAAFLPIAPLSSHSHGCPDWTCIAVGFSSGYIRFFTENMDLIAADLLQPEPLLHIRACSLREIANDGGQSAETVFAIYCSVICCLPGFSLLQTLRSRRKEVAFTRARSEESTPQVTLEVKKYDFPVQPVRDACFVSSGLANRFDHLLNASIVEGFHGNYRPSPAQHSLVASTGPYTWLQFQSTLEGVAAPIELTDVALQVMSKLPGWLGLGSQKTPKTVARPSEKLSPKCRLLDRRREGRSVFPSPDGSLLAVTDSLGRVTLVDVRTSTAIRMWKGYRDAECGYLEVEEELPKSRHRHRPQSASSSNHQKTTHKVLLLVIYAPKKGLIEIFPLRHGRRVAALNVGKNGRLVYTPHGFIGNNSIPRKSSRPVLFSLVFLSEEGLMDITVPFHCAFLDSSARAKDLHHLKQFKIWVKETERSEEELVAEIQTMCSNLETVDVRLLAVDYLSSVKLVTPTALCSALNIFLENAADNDSDGGNGHRRNLFVLCKQLRNVVDFYIFLKNLDTESEEGASSHSLPLTDALLLSESEVSIFVEFVNNMQLICGPKRESKVTFFTSSGQSLPQFLQSLDLSESGPIVAKPNLSEEEYKPLGELLFSRIAVVPSHLDAWIKQVKLSNMSIEFLSHCLFTYWLNRPIANAEQDVHVFMSLLQAVVSVSDDSLASSDYSVESPWWTELRSVISKSTNGLAALVIAVCCRSVSIQCEQKMELTRVNKDHCDEVNDFENVSADTWQWDLLITHLEDLALLNTVLGYKPTSARKMSMENNQVSLTELKSAGEETVSEKVAKWLLRFQIPGHLLLDKSDVEFQKSSLTVAENVIRQPGQKLFKGDEDIVLPLIEVADVAEPESETQTIIIKYLTLLKRRFPYSLTSSAVLSHLAWEVMSSWQRNLADIDLLQSAIEYLKAIPSAHLRSGVGVMAWTTYLKMHFEAVLRLMSKVGKIPTDTLCIRELGIPRDQIIHFLKNTTLLLTTILDACAEHPQTKFIHKHETLWRGTGTGLVAVAATRPSPSEDMVLIHFQTSVFFHMASALELKEKTLFSYLLDSMKTDLFRELTQRPTTSIHNTGLIKSLTKFLLRAVSASIQTIREVETENGSIGLDTDASNYWLRMCYTLANACRIPIAVLHVRHVCELYSNGYDRQAEEVIQSADYPGDLCSQLIVIVGQRINALIASAASPEKMLSNLNPSLTSRLKSLGEGGERSRVNLKDTEILVTRLFHMIPEKFQADKQLLLLIAENLPGLRE